MDIMQPRRKAWKTASGAASNGTTVEVNDSQCVVAYCPRHLQQQFF